MRSARPSARGCSRALRMVGGAAHSKELVHWERFPDNHVYYIPLGCMVPRDADNIIVAGRCVDADSHALSAIRVMGPCIAMGTAAAHALDLAGSDPCTTSICRSCSSVCRTTWSVETSAHKTWRSIMKLTDSERAMLDGGRGQGETEGHGAPRALCQGPGAERFVDTHNVAGVPGSYSPLLRSTTMQPLKMRMT